MPRPSVPPLPADVWCEVLSRAGPLALAPWLRVRARDAAAARVARRVGEWWRRRLERWRHGASVRVRFAPPNDADWHQGSLRLRIDGEWMVELDPRRWYVFLPYPGLRMQIPL